MATGSTIPDAAKACGISERTVYRRLADSEFRQRISDVRSAAVDRAVGCLSHYSAAAAAKLHALLDAADPDGPALGVQLGAAKALLDSTLKMRQAEDIDKRLRALEEAASTRRTEGTA